MRDNNRSHSRKKFISLSLTAAALLTTFRFIIPAKKKKTGTVKMLTQDGKLVEVDIADLPSQRKKISDKELQNWVNKK